MQEYVRLPFSGICTFLGAPIVKDIDSIDTNEIIILGVPYDMGTTYRSGTRFGPQSIRTASLIYTYHKSSLFDTTLEQNKFIGFWDINRKKFVLKNAKISDAGDVSIIPANPIKSFENITKAAEIIVNKGAFPVFIGGDHSITYPILKAYSNFNNIHIIHFDTHIDTWENVGHAELGHGSPLFLAQNLPFVKCITHIGLHGFLNDEDRYIEAIQKKHNVITAADIHLNKHIDFDEILPKNMLYYLSFDIDVCDPAFAPGTGTPECGGLLPFQVFSLLELIAKNRKFIGMDLVEVSPPFDHANITSLLATQIIITFLDAIA